MKIFWIIFAFFLIIPSVSAHTVQFSNMEAQKGRIMEISDALLVFRTPEGDKTIIRGANGGAYSDTIVRGFPFIKKTYKNIPCKVVFMDNEYVHALTPEGKIKLHKLKVRDVIIYIP